VQLVGHLKDVQNKLVSNLGTYQTVSGM
jgi:hypothetical protein